MKRDMREVMMRMVDGMTWGNEQRCELRWIMSRKEKRIKKKKKNWFLVNKKIKGKLISVIET